VTSVPVTFKDPREAPAVGSEARAAGSTAGRTAAAWMALVGVGAVGMIVAGARGSRKAE